MKRKTRNIILITVIITLILFVIAFYLYDVLWVQTPYTKNLFRTVAIVFLLLGTLIKLVGKAGRKPLYFYEKAYAEELGVAFSENPVLRKRLLRACRLYDEGNFRSALRQLSRLLSVAKSDADVIPLLLFIAVCYSGVHMKHEAIKVYEELLRIDPNNAKAHSNLGILFVDIGDFDTAIAHYSKSIEIKANNYSAYINRANCYFRLYEYDKAILDAKQALVFKNNGREAATLLTIIYALQGDDENKKKYYHISIAAGRKPEELNDAIRYYLNGHNIPAEEE